MINNTLENNISGRRGFRLRHLGLREFGFISANRQPARRTLPSANIGASNPQIIDPACQLRRSVSRQGPFVFGKTFLSVRFPNRTCPRDRSLIPRHIVDTSTRPRVRRMPLNSKLSGVTATEFPQHEISRYIYAAAHITYSCARALLLRNP